MRTTFIFLSIVSFVSANQGVTLPLHRHRAPASHDRVLAQIPVSTNIFTYQVDLGMGNESFPLLLDTGSSDLWILSTSCNTGDCQYLKTYSPSSSIVLSDAPFELNYLKGSVSGDIACDTAVLGAYQVSCQVFGLASKANNLHLSSNGNSGILGMAFPSIAGIDVTNGVPLLSNLFAYLDEPNRFFALALGRETDDNSASSFSIGELDLRVSQDFSDFFFLPVLKAGADDYDYWKIPLLFITINSTVLPLSTSLIPNSPSPIAVLDSGTTLVLGPTIDVNAFWDAVNSAGEVARLNPASGMWEVKCERAISVSFVYGSEDKFHEFPLHPEDVNWDAGDIGGEWCMGGIQPNDRVNSGDWLVGDVFLRNVYVTHHGENSTCSPTIGLLSMTDTGSALEEFRKARGPDMSPVLAVATRERSSVSNHSTLIYAGSAGGGFVGGVLLTVLFRVVHSRRR